MMYHMIAIIFTDVESDVILMIVSALGEWAKNTCLSFQEADDHDVTYLLLKEGKKYYMSDF